MKNSIKDMAWNMFKSTGNLNTFLELKQIEDIESNISNIKKVEPNEADKNERDNNFGKQYGRL